MGVTRGCLDLAVARSFVIIGRLSPRASAREAKLCRRSCGRRVVGGGRRAALLQNLGRNTVGNSLRRLVNRIARQVGVACRRLHVAVPEQLTVHWQGLAERQRAGRKGPVVDHGMARKSGRARGGSSRRCGARSRTMARVPRSRRIGAGPAGSGRRSGSACPRSSA